MLVIYKKELQSYFNGMMGYVFIAFALALIGVYLTAVNLTQGYPNFEYVLDSVRFLFILIMPILTMRSLSEERRQRTDQEQGKDGKQHTLYNAPSHALFRLARRGTSSLFVFQRMYLLLFSEKSVTASLFGVHQKKEVTIRHVISIILPPVNTENVLI